MSANGKYYFQYSYMNYICPRQVKVSTYFSDVQQKPFQNLKVIFGSLFCGRTNSHVMSNRFRHSNTLCSPETSNFLLDILDYMSSRQYFSSMSFSIYFLSTENLFFLALSAKAMSKGDENEAPSRIGPQWPSSPSNTASIFRAFELYPLPSQT
jgi:hypothetical protein